MASKEIPSEPPPPYQEATSSTSSAQPSHLHHNTTHEHPPHNGVPPQARRSMEDETRELPSGWVRQYDSKAQHQFFVDTNADPPRAIWQHPYDDATYISSLSPSERSRIQNLHPHHGPADDSHDSAEEHRWGKDAPLPPREEKTGGATRFGRKMKDKLTRSTHEEREAQRRQEEEEEARAYELHQKFRAAMSKAEETGVPQFLGKDHDGKDVYIEPSYAAVAGPRAYDGDGYGYNPHQQGPYSNPNARFVAPRSQYNRPYGYGYGGGLGVPLMMGGGLGLGGMMMMGGGLGGMGMGGGFGGGGL